MASNNTNIEIKLKDVRLSFDNLFEPQVQKSEKTGEDDISYNCVLLLDKEKDAEQIKLVTDAMVQAREARWPGMNKKIPPERRCMRDGEPLDDETNTREPLYDGYENCMYISAKRKVKKITDSCPVQLIGPRKELDPQTNERRFKQLTSTNGGPDLLYGGCYVNAIIRIYAYDGSRDGNPDRINASLEVVQHKRDGERFGAKRVDANSAMDEEEGDDDDMPATSGNAGASTGGDAFDPLG